jgi:tetratricopeptide (TPR) repeat protein
MRTIAMTCGALLFAAALAHAGAIDDCNQVRDPQRQFRGCSAYLKQGSGRPQDLATAHINRANVYARRGKYGFALRDYEAAIRRDPSNPLAFYNRGNVYFDTQQYPLAIADFTRAIQIDPGFALAYLNRGLAHERGSDNLAAVGDYRRALELDPSARVAHERLKRLQSE